jgi:fatty acid desaturase
MNMRHYTVRSDWRGALIVVTDLLLLSAGIAVGVWGDGAVWTFFAIWLVGLKQFSIGEAIVHEAAHRHLFRSSRVNDLVGLLCSLPFLFTLQQYREQHLRHHVTSGREDDPIHDDYAEYGLYDPRVSTFFIWWVKPLSGYATYQYLKYNIGFDSWRSAAQILGFWLPIIVICGWRGWLWCLIVYWFVPMFSVFACLLYWSEIEDHFGTLCGTRSNVGWWSNRLITHNGGFHQMHHEYPGIPWFMLPRAHAEVGQGHSDISKGMLDTFQQVSRWRRALPRGRT